MSHDPPGTTYKINEERVGSEYFRNKLKLKSFEVKKSFAEKYPHANKFFDDRGINLGKIREHSAKVITTGALTGTLLFSPTPIFKGMPAVAEIIKNVTDFTSGGANVPKQQALLDSLRQILPQKIGPLDRSQEKTLEQVFSQTVGVNARATLEGEHLNTTYGYIGAEQHLARFPGDTMAGHPKIPENDEGMAPGLGAWGYVPAENEKWYAVVQTLYLPDWSTRQPYLQKWYKHRKVLIVNTMNGNAVVANIADAGPAAWTGKHFGGSPEVMDYLGGSRYKKGPVIIFFVDDPDNKVPLGPVEYNDVNIPGVAFTQT
ncbi:MAG: hypothetical protein UU12_C0011G0011 [Candidatus Woesebacteria bacterium GW2011_GWA2_40_7b]|uniref:Uncharacterized protein n=1 Tax=Candidatus Woesebacteria bacterium GW2011_GWA2_40_7b TaxID=1618563 RepID=A0A0G0T861_9BACT|nr:MAG: hypothetical protein UU12_C0011G0011 [Candidatus Woesebacteria bacterium GW2011_GWA2_40_7b]